MVNDFFEEVIGDGVRIVVSFEGVFELIFEVYFSVGGFEYVCFEDCFDVEM